MPKRYGRNRGLARRVVLGEQELVAAAGIFDRTGPASRMHGRGSVKGTITGRDVILNSLTILRYWGPTCYLRCLRAAVSRRPSTFLGVLYRNDSGGGA
jgi:hypothetical protein